VSSAHQGPGEKLGGRLDAGLAGCTATLPDEMDTDEAFGDVWQDADHDVGARL
jgi:hypothetical protein